MSGGKSLAAFFSSEGHQAWGWRLTRSKGMEDLSAFRGKEVRGAAVEERKKENYFSAEGQCKLCKCKIM